MKKNINGYPRRQRSYYDGDTLSVILDIIKKYDTTKYSLRPLSLDKQT